MKHVPKSFLIYRRLDTTFKAHHHQSKKITGHIISALGRVFFTLIFYPWGERDWKHRLLLTLCNAQNQPPQALSMPVTAVIQYWVFKHMQSCREKGVELENCKTTLTNPPGATQAQARGSRNSWCCSVLITVLSVYFPQLKEQKQIKLSPLPSLKEGSSLLTSLRGIIY